jgi:hypothetical protein
VARTPEEEVRQALLQKMVTLGYPKGLICVEKKVGLRRFDVVCYISQMRPLLLCECKADEITDSTLKQACGYNWMVQAPFICLANRDQTILLWQQGDQMASIPYLPPYAELARRV